MKLENQNTELRFQRIRLTRLEIAKPHHDISNVTMVYVTHDPCRPDLCLARRECGTSWDPENEFLTGAFARQFDCTTLGIRSEHIDITKADEGIWTGRVVHAENLGPDHFLFVDIGATEPLVIRRNGKLFGTMGDMISMQPMPNCAHRFDDDGRPCIKLS